MLTRREEGGFQYYYKLFKHYYESSPVNFSSVTGLSHLELPCLKGNWFTGCYSQVRESGFLGTLLEASKLTSTHPSGACYFWVGIEQALLITKPQHVKQLFFYNNAHLSRASGLTESIAKVFGKNIFFSTGDLWRHKRILWKPWLYTSKALGQLAPIMGRVCEKHLQTLASNGETGIDLDRFFTTFTLDVVGSCLLANDSMSDSANELSSLLTAALQKATDPQVASINKILRLGKPFYQKPLGYDAIAKEIREFFAKNILKPHCDQLEETHCLLKAIRDLYQETNGEDPIQNEDYLSDSIFLAFAGHATTAITFQFVIKLLAQNPNISEKLHQTLFSQLNEKEFTIENINEVEYLDCIIKETLRLCPPVPIMSRGVENALTLVDLPVSANRTAYEEACQHSLDTSRIHVAKNTTVIVSPYLIHRSPDFYPNPERFDPERFSKKSGNSFSEHHYMPFGYGPRNCLGQKFALQELKLLLATLYYHYRIEIPDNDMTIDLKEVVLTPKIKTQAKFIRREEIPKKALEKTSPRSRRMF